MESQIHEPSLSSQGDSPSGPPPRVQPCFHTVLSALSAPHSLYTPGLLCLSQYHTGTLYATQLSSLVLFALGQRGFLRDKDIFVTLGEPPLPLRVVLRPELSKPELSHTCAKMIHMVHCAY